MALALVSTPQDASTQRRLTYKSVTDYTQDIAIRRSTNRTMQKKAPSEKGTSGARGGQSNPRILKEEARPPASPARLDLQASRLDRSGREVVDTVLRSELGHRIETKDVGRRQRPVVVLFWRDQGRQHAFHPAATVRLHTGIEVDFHLINRVANEAAAEGHGHSASGGRALCEGYAPRRQGEDECQVN